MAHVHQLKRRKTSEETFTVDGNWLRDEARDAIRSYFIPFSGVYAAIVGKDVRVVNASERKHSKTPVQRKKR